MPVIPVPGRLRQEDFCEFKTSPGYIVRPGFKNKDKTLTSFCFLWTYVIESLLCADYPRC